ncbi:TldD/PmbA family protein [Gloeobacter violaceus]|uniref:Gll1562 protein n=1 Tax=Gloeobacter violaceus (strain ATCC 29082 / PCC 7421) TaxID=251221 RepID=Q7NKB6_GLOVI|nr:TldD/PmbA family protein [Gloeobacter violaceus]BAC89503.1 gll1562 [Gloeobacter violaceus PCC 7421]
MAFLNAERAQKMVETALKAASAKDVLVRLGERRNAVTRFANNAITQNTLDAGTELAVEVAFENRRASARVSSLSEEAIRTAVRRAEELARVARPDPEYLPPLPRQQYLAVDAYDPATANLTPVERAKRAGRIAGAAGRASLRAAGTVESAERVSVVAASSGLFAYHLRTDAQIGCTLQGPDSSGWARDVASRMALLSPERIAQSAIEQARRGVNPVAVEPGRYTVILAPAAVGTLLFHLVEQMDARDTLDGVTFLSGKMGRQLVGSNITLRTDPANTRLPGVPFDEEGLPQPQLPWIDRGVFQQMRWDRFTAQKNNRPPVPAPRSLVMEGEDRSIEDLIRSTERGLLVTHVWYVRDVKPDETTVTGLTRDGTFLIEKGQLTRGVKVLRFNQSLLAMLSSTLALSRPEAAADNELPPSLLPALKVAEFNFVSGSSF